MNNKYAIIDNEGGWLINTIVWNGDLETWQPPEGTSAILVENIDINNLPTQHSQELVED